MKLFTVHEREAEDDCAYLIGVRESQGDAESLAEDVFTTGEQVDVWIEEWDSDGPWYDSTVVYRKERTA